MPNYRAAIATDPRIAAGEFCDVTVIVLDGDGELTDEIAFTADTTVLAGDDPEILTAAETDAKRALEANGWDVIGDWRLADDDDSYELYASVARKPLTTHQLAAKLLELPDMPVYHDPDMTRDEWEILHGVHEVRDLRSFGAKYAVID